MRPTKKAHKPPEPQERAPRKTKCLNERYRDFQKHRKLNLFGEGNWYAHFGYLPAFFLTICAFTICAFLMYCLVQASSILSDDIQKEDAIYKSI